MTLARFLHFRQTLGQRDRVVLDALAAKVADACAASLFTVNGDQTVKILERALVTFASQDIEALALYVVNTGRAVARGAAAGGDGQALLNAATKEMQESQMAFNLQYLQLQEKMKEENASYTRISNIMKSKHDTVKNSISNVR